MATTRTNNERSRDVKSEPETGTPRPSEANSDEDEFKVTVRKLERTVRPRGVLAE